ncbi:hypothetical protein ACQPW1_39370 [Nocardia sp. CA-128927]|uniref:hypothetical protein n=1 Tax=Nocardia sp. CA-128927 TaxID=3239975 RepID=UPI003D9A032E
MNYAAEMDRIIAEYTSASRTVITRFLETDARTTRSGTELFDELRRELIPQDQDQQETPEEQTAGEAREEHDRIVRGTLEPATASPVQRTPASKRSRDVYVLPSDWTEEDEEGGYRNPKSWLE